MKIWKLDYYFGKNEEYEGIQVEDTRVESFDEFSNIFHKRTNGEYDNLKVRIVNKEGNYFSGRDERFKVDHPYCWTSCSAMVLNKRALDLLMPLIGDAVEIIPLDCENREYYIVNILSVIDAVNYEKSEFRRLSSGLIVEFKKYSFIKEALEGENLFKVFLNKYINTTEIFVSEAFKKIVEENELTGFKFIEVWDSENDN